MNFHENKKRLSALPETANVGAKWTTEEEMTLLDETEQKLPLQEIALLHKRTVGGIRSHLLLLARDFITEQGQSLQEVSEMLNLSEDEITKSIERQKEKDTKKSVKKVQSIVIENKNTIGDDKYMEILVEIRDLLKIIAEK